MICNGEYICCFYIYRYTALIRGLEVGALKSALIVRLDIERSVGNLRFSFYVNCLFLFSSNLFVTTTKSQQIVTLSDQSVRPDSPPFSHYLYRIHLCSPQSSQCAPFAISLRASGAPCQFATRLRSPVGAQK